MINKIIVNGEQIELNEESQVPFTYTFSQAGTQKVEFGLDKTDEICAYAFQNCNTLTYINIPNEIKLIKRHAFENCSALPEIRLHKDIEYVGKHVFDGCTSLSKVKFESNNPPQFNSTLPNDTICLVPNQHKFVEVNFEDIDQSGDVQYFYRDIWSGPSGSANPDTVDALNYKPVSDPSDLDADVQYYRNVWDSIADSDHVKEYKDEVTVSDVQFEFPNVRLTVGTEFELHYTLLPENHTNNKLYWYPQNKEILNINDNTGVDGMVKLIPLAPGACRVYAIPETSGGAFYMTVNIINA